MFKHRQNTTQRVESALTTLYQTPVPDVNFVQQLEQTLAQRITAEHRTISRWQRLGDTLNRRRWATAVVTLLLLMSVTVTAVGPQRVWAALGDWLRFIPGFGFVDVSAAYVLAETKTISVDGIEVGITQAVVTDETVLTFTISGLPKIEAFSESLKRFDDIETINLELHFTNGDILTPTSQLPIWASKDAIVVYSIFPQLPHRIKNVVLAVNTTDVTRTFKLPTDGVRLAFGLLPANDEEVAERFPQSQSPEIIADVEHNIGLSIRNLAYGESEMAVETVWDNASSWKRIGVGYPDYIIDQEFRFYQPTYNTMLPNDFWEDHNDFDCLLTRTFLFPPLKPESENLTLMISSISVYTDSAPFPITFTVDLGEAPQHNQTYPLDDMAFEVAGFPYQFNSATFRYTEAITDINLRPQLDPSIRYVLDIAIESPFDNGRLINYSLDVVPKHSTQPYYGGMRPYTGGVSRADKLDDNLRWFGHIYFTDYPTGNLTVEIKGARYRLRGPWRVTWAVP